jgi:hypothetical protein
MAIAINLLNYYQVIVRIYTMSLKSFFKFTLFSISATFTSLVLVSPSSAQPTLNFTSLATDQDVYPANYPYSYSASQSLVLDMTSSGFIAQPFFQLEFPDLITERQLNAFRSITREMYDLQTLSTPDIRTRDLSSPYTTALSEFCGYYLASGAVYPVTGTPNATQCNPPVPVAVVEPPAPPQPTFTPAPVPALW